MPSAPLNFQVVNVIGSASSLEAQWEQPAQVNGILTNYSVLCRALPDQFYPEQELLDLQDESFVQLDVSLTMLSLTDLVPFTEYECFVTASTVAGTGPASNNDTARTTEDAPSGPPRDFNYTSISSTSVTLTWRRPDTPNGIISEYTLIYMNETDLQSRTIPALDDISHVYEHVVMSLNEATDYVFELSATTGGGTGPNATLALMTEEDGMNLLNLCVS